MLTFRATRSFLLPLATAASLLATGCAREELFAQPGMPGVYDSQECVENALRNEPDPQGVRDATVAFAEACRGGEAASCSALGVMYELGRGVGVDAARAAELYARACEAGNARACGNWSALALRQEKSRQRVAMRGAGKAERD